ncbi:Glycogen debranching enzyme, partial [Orchesella cincta]
MMKTVTVISSSSIIKVSVVSSFSSSAVGCSWMISSGALMNQLKIISTTRGRSPKDKDDDMYMCFGLVRRLGIMGSTSGNSGEVRVIQLEETNLEGTVYRVEKGTVLQFRLSSSLHGCQVTLQTNHPLTAGVKFCRSKYYKVGWILDRQNEETYTNLTANIAGNFQYRFTKDGVDAGSGYFIVDPVLRVGSANTVLKLDSISCQTHLSKSLGDFATWKIRLEVAHRSGYNMVHFTPIQELGGSNSAYSIANQNALNPIFGSVTFDQVGKLIEEMKTEWEMLSICDLVLNHTANETPWLKTNPESCYNLENSPHLRPAYILETILYQFSHDIAQGKYVSKGLPAAVKTEEHLLIARQILHEIVPQFKLEEMFMVDVEETLKEFKKKLQSLNPRTNSQDGDESKLTIVQDTLYRRLKSTVDLDVASSVYFYKRQEEDINVGIDRALERLRIKLIQLNDGAKHVFKSHLTSAIDNILAGARYERLQNDGPLLAEVSEENPLIHRYFLKVGLPDREPLETEELLTFGENCRFVLAHNGWVMNDDPLRNFAESDSNVYLRRELIPWSDSCKLRYSLMEYIEFITKHMTGQVIIQKFGEKPSDCPFLWDTMKKYVETTASIFAGVRLDNCHSTPIHVAEYFLDVARNAKPDLYVVAELFTNSDWKDNIFVNRLGITSLIRELNDKHKQVQVNQLFCVISNPEAMSAWDSHEEGRLVFRYGGIPVGAFHQEKVRPMTPCIAHALFMDVTHDNPSPIEKRSVYDVLPTAALVSMASCATGSNRGLDELIPHHIHVVHEKRFYTNFVPTQGKTGNGLVNDSTGIITARRSLNNLHSRLGAVGFTEVYVDQMETDIVAVTRHNPRTHERIVLVAYTVFGYPDQHFKRCGGIKDLIFEGELSEVVLEAQLKPIDSTKGTYPRPGDFVEHPIFLNGLVDFVCDVRENISVDKSQFVTLEGNAVKFTNFQPGSIVIFKILPPSSIVKALESLRSLLAPESVKKVTDSLSLRDLNKVLYRCEEEEKEDTGYGAYDIPNFGKLVYCGLQGINSVMMSGIRSGNDLGHPVCDNLRGGNWIMDYIAGRLLKDDNTKALGNFLQGCFQNVAEFPRYLVPTYFDDVLKIVCFACLESAFSKMSKFVQISSPFTQSLALGSVQCCGISKSGPLPHLSPCLAEPKPFTVQSDNGLVQDCVTMAAVTNELLKSCFLFHVNIKRINYLTGLTHFSTGYMRNWGRDTFISLPGLLLVTGRFQDARYHILSYASVLRHGLIPNLLDRGTSSRYNCRDATWFWLQSIKKYVTSVPRGETLLKDRVSRMWPNDFGESVLDHSVEQCLEDVMQEALQKHFEGISFRERNAGLKIDAHMTDEGFNVTAGVNLETGFVYGGNARNCGTWMDKMGSSEKAGNKGIPATPRDGSAVELTGLCASVVKFLAEMNSAGKYRYNSVERKSSTGQVVRWTFDEWYEKIRENFELHYWIPETAEKSATINNSLVNRRGIYKDSVGATAEYCDYQLRPNFLVAMAVAPELFTPQNAHKALNNVSNILLSVLGMRTLDPSDWNYDGNYDNSNDSSDRKVAHGFNYHNGPEWLWPVGCYLHAYLKISSKLGEVELREAVKHIRKVMSNHWSYIQQSMWKSLPELTNKNGSECWGSCRVQAWSVATLLEVQLELSSILKERSQ